MSRALNILGNSYILNVHVRTVNLWNNIKFFFLIGLFPSRCVHMTNFIEVNRIYTTQLTVVILQLVTSATCFGLV